MSRTQHFFIEGQYLGEVLREPRLVEGQLLQPKSLLFYCGTCGDVWAKMPVDGCEWLGYRMSCRKHADAYDSAFGRPGGSIIMSWESDLISTFPEGVLKRELNLWLNYTQGTRDENF
jgi:hypothetical protein